MRAIPSFVEKSASALISVTRKLEPLYRDNFDAYLKPPIEKIAQHLIKLKLEDHGLDIAEEMINESEGENTSTITETMNRFLVKEYKNTGKTAERAGNTKTYGLVKATFTVNNNLPKSLQLGIFKAGRRYPAYIRFGGPGPRVVPDEKDNGILSIGMKLMGVPGKKLLNDEKTTVDFSAISSPTFTTPNVRENVKLQTQIGLGTPAWYFLNPLDSHYLDMIMQGLYARNHASPLELTYYSCVPYLFGRHKSQDRAIKFAFIPRIKKPSTVGPTSDNYLRETMIKSLSEKSVTFDFAIQFQTDPVSMPLENASVAWCTKKSPFINVATIEIPRQKFDYPEQDQFARNLTFNPWHTLPVHRPLGNQNRARKQIYQYTAKMRQAINSEAHIEPTGKEVFSKKSNQNTKGSSKTTASKTRSA